MSVANVLKLDEYRDRRVQRLSRGRALLGRDPYRRVLYDHLAEVARLTGADRAAAVWIDEGGPELVHPHVVVDLLSDRPRRIFSADPLRRAWDLGIPGAWEGGSSADVTLPVGVVAIALGSDGAISETDDSGFHVPLLLSLPADLFSGRRSLGSASLVDVSAALVEVGSLPPSRGRFDARPSISTIFMGTTVYNWNLLLGPQGHVLRRASLRMTAGGLPPADPAQVANWLLAEPAQNKGFTLLDRGPAESDASRLYVKLIEQLL